MSEKLPNELDIITTLFEDAILKEELHYFITLLTYSDKDFIEDDCSEAFAGVISDLEERIELMKGLEKNFYRYLVNHKDSPNETRRQVKLMIHALKKHRSEYN